MHKENCTDSSVMSGRGLNMSVVIYNGGLLSTSTTPSGSAPQPRDPRRRKNSYRRSHVTSTAEQNSSLWCRCTSKHGCGLFIYALLGCSGGPEVTFRAKKLREGRDVNYPRWSTRECKESEFGGWASQRSPFFDWSAVWNQWVVIQTRWWSAGVELLPFSSTFTRLTGLTGKYLLDKHHVWSLEPHHYSASAFRLNSSW